MANCHLYYLGTLEEANSAPDIPTPNEVANAEPEEEGPMKYVPLFQRRDTCKEE